MPLERWLGWALLALFVVIWSRYHRRLCRMRRREPVFSDARHQGSAGGDVTRREAA